MSCACLFLDSIQAGSMFSESPCQVLAGIRVREKLAPRRSWDIFGSKYGGPTTVARTHTTRAVRLSGFASSVDGDMPRDTKSKAGKCDPTLLFRKRGIQEHTCVLDDYPSVWILISDNSVAFPQYVCKRQEIFA
jgi:hypothetical protein